MGGLGDGERKSFSSKTPASVSLLSRLQSPVHWFLCWTMASVTVSTLECSWIHITSLGCTYICYPALGLQRTSSWLYLQDMTCNGYDHFKSPGLWQVPSCTLPSAHFSLTFSSLVYLKMKFNTLWCFLIIVIHQNLCCKTHLMFKKPYNFSTALWKYSS